MGLIRFLMGNLFKVTLVFDLFYEVSTWLETLRRLNSL